MIQPAFVENLYFNEDWGTTFPLRAEKALL